MNVVTRRLIEAIHAGGRKLVLATTGGGAGAADLLLRVPGGSRSVLEVQVPYDEEALAEFLGQRPAQACSLATSREMARRAYERAGWLAPSQPVLGAGCTASLATHRPKQGPHRFHVTMHSGERILSQSLLLHKGVRSREEEEAVVDAVLLNALAEALDLPQRMVAPLLPGEAVRSEAAPVRHPLARLLHGEVSWVRMSKDGALSFAASTPGAILPGAFNPLHAGHWRLAETAARILGQAVDFELSVVNVDKPALSGEQLQARLQQFRWRGDVWLTRAATFPEKAALFPGVIFVVGADTAERIVAMKYYGGSEAQMLAGLDEIRRHGCRFLVAGREDANGRFTVVETLDIPASHRDLFTAIPESEYHVVISSTDLRAAKQA